MAIYNLDNNEYEYITLKGRKYRCGDVQHEIAVFFSATEKIQFNDDQLSRLSVRIVSDYLSFHNKDIVLNELTAEDIKQVRSLLLSKIEKWHIIVTPSTFMGRVLFFLISRRKKLWRSKKK